MAEKVNVGWLKGTNKEKLAPKTFISQVINKNGKSLETILEELNQSNSNGEVADDNLTEIIELEDGKFNPILFFLEDDYIVSNKTYELNSITGKAIQFMGSVSWMQYSPSAEDYDVCYETTRDRIHVNIAVDYRYSLYIRCTVLSAPNDPAITTNSPLAQIDYYLYGGTGQLITKVYEYATKEEVDKLSKEIPTKTSELENDSGFVTEGTVEITDGEPTKESTVMTLNPNAEEVNLYTAEDIDAMKGTWTTLLDTTLEEDVNTIEVTTDMDGNPFKAKKMRLLFVGTMTDLRLNLYSDPTNGKGTPNMQNTFYYQAFKANSLIQTLVEIGEQLSNGLCKSLCMKCSYGIETPYTLNGDLYTAVSKRENEFLDRIRMSMQTDKYFTAGTRVLVEGVLES